MKRIPLFLSALSLICLLSTRAQAQSPPATFTDANWSSLGAIPGASGTINATFIDNSGNLYVGGSFFVIGNTAANYIAKWDGTKWSPLSREIGGTPKISAFAI